jgi:hypothetical protein
LACHSVLPGHDLTGVPTANQAAPWRLSICRRQTVVKRKLKTAALHGVSTNKAVFKILKILQDFSSHRICEHIHEALNIDKK